MKKAFSFPFHPLLLAIYPILALLSANISQIDLWLVWRPLLISFITGGILFTLAGLLIKPLSRAALAVSFTLLLLFSYGHVHEILKNSNGFLFELSHHSVLGGIFILFFLAGNGLILWKTKGSAATTSALNLISLALVILAIIPIASYSLNLGQAKNKAQSGVSQDISFNGPDEEKPDIYYILLDTYTREDALLSDFNFNNSGFISGLKQKGFQVGDCSLSNYAFTELAMASTFNIDYLSNISDQFKPGNSDLTQATALIQNNYVRWQLEGLGYKTIAFETGYAWNQWKDADLYVTPNTNMTMLAPIRPFEEMFLRSTIFRLIADTSKKLRSGLVESLVPHHENHVARTMTALKWLGQDLPVMDGPKFVYAHINVPHVPFIFEPDGSLIKDPDFFRGEKDYPVKKDYYIPGYLKQVEFLNNRIPGIVQNIIEKSERPVIIILQGDHGFMDANRMEILNAVYFPDNAGKLVTTSTPVNTFRIIFNTYFNGEFLLLENHSYQSTAELPYDLTEVFERNPACSK